MTAYFCSYLISLNFLPSILLWKLLKPDIRFADAAEVSKFQLNSLQNTINKSTGLANHPCHSSLHHHSQNLHQLHCQEVLHDCQEDQPEGQDGLEWRDIWTRWPAPVEKARYEPCYQLTHLDPSSLPVVVPCLSLHHHRQPPTHLHHSGQRGLLGVVGGAGQGDASNISFFSGDFIVHDSNCNLWINLQLKSKIDFPSLFGKHMPSLQVGLCSKVSRQVEEHCEI